jgi:hypothetical protein
MSVSCECCTLSGSSLCDRLVTHPEESFQMWCVIVYNLEISRMRVPWSALGCSTRGKYSLGTIIVPRQSNRAINKAIRPEIIGDGT